MHIKYFQKTTLIDFPKTIAGIVFVDGCNFCCPYCYNKDLVLHNPATDLDPQNVLADIAKRQKYLEGIVITGGEPTIQTGLEDFIKQIKAMGLKVKLDTNGADPIALERLINSQLIDYYAMDIKTTLAKYPQVVGRQINPTTIQQSIQLIKNVSCEYEFRTTVWQEGFSQQDLLEILELIKGSKNYYLQNFHRTEDENTAKFTPFTKESIQPILAAATNQNLTINLRGDWR